MATMRGKDFRNQIELLKKQQAFTDEQRREQNKFTFKINRLNALDTLTSTLVQLQSANRISAIQAIGQDPLGGAIQARGGTQVGRSVFERIRREMRDFSQAALPHVDGATASIEEINAAIEDALGLLDNDPGQLQGGAGAVIGAAHGATIRTDGQRGRRALKNTDTGETGQGVVVGELGPELITDIGAGKFKVTPLSNGGGGPTGGTIALSGRGAGQAIAGNMRPRLLRAGHGGEFEAAHLFEEGNVQGESTLTVQSIAPLFKALGFDQVPLSTRASEAFGGVQQRPLLGSGFGGVSGITQGDPSDIFTRLGTRPRLIFEPDLQLFLHIGPDGVVRSLGNAEEAAGLTGFGINTENAQTLTLAELKQMGFTVPRGPAGPFGPGSGPEFPPAQAQGSDLFFSDTGGTAFGELQPLRAPLNESGSIAVLLPDPRLLANVWNKLDLATQNVALSFYSKAGIQSGQLLRRMRFFRGESAGRPATALG
ncbi:MAG: hypothetical protein IIC89_04340 [Chloroflexi bacterium]|nr:hypothetical protein [Chloroflexota bacterium]